MDTEYRNLSTENLKNKSVNGNITFSLPLAINELLGTVFAAKVRNKFHEFICTAFGVVDKEIIVESKRLQTLRFKALAIIINSTSPDFIINSTGIIAKRILKTIVADHPDIVYKSGIHLNKKTKALQEDSSIDIVNAHMIKDIMNNLLYSMIKETSSDIFITPLPTNTETSKKYGNLEIPVYMDNLITSTLSPRYNYKMVVYENLNINDDNEIAKSNLAFVEHFLSLYVITRDMLIKIYLVKSQNKVIMIQLSDIALPNWNELFQLTCCAGCYETGFIRQNMVPIKEDRSLCIICAKEAMKSREFVHEKHGRMPCFSGECGDNGDMFFMFRQGTYISDNGNVLNVKNASKLPWLYRCTLFLEHLDNVYHSKFLAMLDVPSVVEPDDDNADIMYNVIKDKLKSIITHIADYTTELQLQAFGINTTEYMMPFVDLTTSINEFLHVMEGDHSNKAMLEYSKHTGKFIRQLGAVYYPHSIDANSPYLLGVIPIKVHETLPRGIIPSDDMSQLLYSIVDTLEEVRCYCFCEHCKTLMTKINNCDTGNCIKCSRVFCMEHGTVLTESNGLCRFERENNTKCSAFFHIVNPNFLFDSVPHNITTTCVCNIHTPVVTK